MKCKNCELEFISKTKRQIYCNQTCCNSYHSKHRKKFLLICKKCNIEFESKHKEQKYCSIKCSNNNNKGYIFTKEKYSEMGKKGAQQRNENRTLLKDTKKECLLCKKEFIPIRSIQKYCNRQCSQSHNIILIRNGTINMNSNNRGKNEIYFANLCIKYFGEKDILCNEKIFKDKNGGLWDADIIIKSLKLCVLYDGIFHFKQVKKNMKLKQIQSRDNIKRKLILSSGYTFYTVKDMGKFNKKFVINEFNLFIHKLNFKSTIHQINNFKHKLDYQFCLNEIKNLKI